MNTILDHVQNWTELVRQANWSVEKLAQCCGVSTRALERYFKKNQGKTPKAWLSEKRFGWAMELLADGASVKEAASAMGYRHASTFAREFKKFYSQCPHDVCSRANIKQSQPRIVALS